MIPLRRGDLRCDLAAHLSLDLALYHTAGIVLVRVELDLARRRILYGHPLVERANVAGLAFSGGRQ